jgi:YHS domain-containing protein
MPVVKDGQPAEIKTASQEVMLRGYCPVTLWSRRKWEKGSPQFKAEYHGQTYHLASAEDLKKFEQNPSRYAPQLLGCDPVVVYESNRAVAGSTRYGAFYDDELYLFTTDDNRKLFKAQPDRFVREKVVLDVSRIETTVR